MPGGHGKGREGYNPASKYRRQKKSLLQQAKSQGLDELDELAQFMSGLVLRKRFPRNQNAANVKSFLGGPLDNVNTIIIEDNGQQKTIVQEPIPDLLDRVFPNASLKDMFVKHKTFTELNLISMEKARKGVSRWIVQYMDTLNLTGFSQTPIRIRSNKLKTVLLKSMDYYRNAEYQMLGFVYALVQTMCRTVCEYYDDKGANIDEELANKSFCVYHETFKTTMPGTHNIVSQVISAFTQISPDRYVSSFVYWNNGHIMLFLHEGEIDALKQVRCDGLYFPASKMAEFGYLQSNNDGITIEDVSKEERTQLESKPNVPLYIFTTSKTQTFSFYDSIDFSEDVDVSGILTCGQLLKIAKEWISHVYTTMVVPEMYKYTGISPLLNVKDIFQNKLEKRFFLHGALGLVDKLLKHMALEISKRQSVPRNNRAISWYERSHLCGLRSHSRTGATYYTAFCRTSQQRNYANVHMICIEDGFMRIALETNTFTEEFDYERATELAMYFRPADLNNGNATYV